MNINIKKAEIHPLRNKNELNKTLEDKSLVTSNSKLIYHVHDCHQERLCNLLQKFYKSQRKSREYRSIISCSQVIRKSTITETNLNKSQIFHTQGMVDPICLHNTTIDQSEHENIFRSAYEENLDMSADLVITQVKSSNLPYQTNYCKTLEHTKLSDLRKSSSNIGHPVQTKKEDCLNLALQTRSQNFSRPKIRSKFNKESNSVHKSKTIFKSSLNSCPQKFQFKLSEIKLDINKTFDHCLKDQKETAIKPIIPAKKRFCIPIHNKDHPDSKSVSIREKVKLYPKNINRAKLCWENSQIPYGILFKCHNNLN